MKTTSPGLRAAVTAIGSERKLAAALGINQQAVQQWREVPLRRLLDVERVTGVAREILRPDLYRTGEVETDPNIAIPATGPAGWSSPRFAARDE
jgi:hypothetical protein